MVRISQDVVISDKKMRSFITQTSLAIVRLLIHFGGYQICPWSERWSRNFCIFCFVFCKFTIFAVHFEFRLVNVPEQETKIS